MPVDRAMLLAELKELQRLTAFEQAVATVRRTQAASTPIAQELADNAAKAGERLTLLAQAVRGVGGTPDVVGPVLGKLGALLQTQLNQVQTLQGALLGDLALEHQLRERARYARTLAVTLGEMSVLPTLDRLDGAHTETIAWLERRLGEVARTGSSALKATPVQVAVGNVRRVVAAPFGYAVDGVNQLGALVGKLTRQAPAAVSQVQDAAADAAGTVAQKAGQAADRASELVEQAADAVVEVAGETAESVSSAADTIADTAADLGATAAEEVGDAAQSVAGTVSDLAGSAAETVSDAAGCAAETVSDAAGSAAETVSDAAGSAADAVSDTADAAAHATADAAASTADAVDSATETVDSAADTAADTAAAQVQDSAETAAETAEQVTHEVLEASGGDDVADEKAPFAGYERLTGDSIMRHVDDTEDVDELRTLLAFEQAHKARKGVLKAAQNRLTVLAGV